MLWGDVYDGGSSERRRRRYCRLPLLGGSCTESVLTRHVAGIPENGRMGSGGISLLISPCVRGYDQDLHTVGIKFVEV